MFTHNTVPVVLREPTAGTLAPSQKPPGEAEHRTKYRGQEGAMSLAVKELEFSQLCPFGIRFI